MTLADNLAEDTRLVRSIFLTGPNVASAWRRLDSCTRALAGWLLVARAETLFRELPWIDQITIGIASEDALGEHWYGVESVDVVVFGGTGYWIGHADVDAALYDVPEAEPHDPEFFIQRIWSELAMLVLPATPPNRQGEAFTVILKPNGEHEGLVVLDDERWWPLFNEYHGLAFPARKCRICDQETEWGHYAYIPINGDHHDVCHPCLNTAFAEEVE